MATPNIGSLFRTADILATEKDDTTNTITAQLGVASSKEVESAGAEWWQQVGFASRPSNVSSGADPSAQALLLTKSDQDLILATRDTRAHRVYSELKAGETCLYATGQDGNGAPAIFLKDSGSVTIYTTDTGKNDGSGVAFTVGPQSLSFVAPWGTLEFSPAGFFVRHHTGASVELGGISGIPAPLDTLTSYAVLSAATVKLDGPAVNLGKSATGVYNQVAFPLAPVPVPLSPIPSTPTFTALSAAQGVFVAAL